MNFTSSMVLVGATLGIALTVGCGDDGNNTSTASAGSTSNGSASTGGGSGSDTNNPTTSSGQTATEGSGGGTMTASTGSNPTTGGDSSTGGNMTSGPGTSTTATTGAVDPSSTGAGSSSSSTTGPAPDLGGPCQGGPVVPDKTFLWAANSQQGTISKIDTETVTEVGRYVVRPDQGGDPSRTSVSLLGHVAVASRNGGVTKVYSDESNCQESNGMPGIQTSKNANFLPWGVEECIAWYTPFNYQSQRPVAWGAGTFNEQTCEWEDEELWTAGNNGGASMDIIILNGSDGSIKDMVAVPAGPGNLNQDFYGIYGAAVDPDGNFWGSQLGSGGKLLKVNRADLSYKIYTSPSGPHWYGMTVDSDGFVYLCSNTIGRFDPVLETWTTAVVGGWTGCMADSSPGGLLWMSDGAGVVGVNRDTLLVEKTWPAGGSYGISVDFDGFVWAVANGSLVSKINPNNGQTQTYNGLVGAYTYSDMIGYSLSAVVLPQ